MSYHCGKTSASNPKYFCGNTEMESENDILATEINLKKSPRYSPFCTTWRRDWMNAQPSAG